MEIGGFFEGFGKVNEQDLRIKTSAHPDAIQGFDIVHTKIVLTMKTEYRVMRWEILAADTWRALPSLAPV